MESIKFIVNNDLTYADVLLLLENFKYDCSNIQNVINVIHNLKNKCECNECILRILEGKNKMVINLK